MTATSGIDKGEILAAAARDPVGAYRRAGYPHELRPAGRNFSGPCPLHPDKDPSFMVTRDGEHAGKFKCFGCQQNGDLIAFYQALHHVAFPEALQALADRLGLAGDTPRPVGPPAPPRAPVAAPDPDPLPEELIQSCHRDLLADSRALAWLLERKGLPVAAVELAGLGMAGRSVPAPPHWRGPRYTIPIPYADGRPGYKDLRGYRPGGTPKMLPWGSGRGGATVYPWAWCRACDPLVWCEGEVDALQFIGRGIGAVTSTCGVDGAIGAGLKLPDLTGKTIYVLGDADPAGDRLRLELPDRLRLAGAARVVRLLWPDTLPDGTPTPPGADPSDLLAACPMKDDDFAGWCGL